MGPTGNDQLLRWNDTCKRLEYLPLGCNGEFLTAVEDSTTHAKSLQWTCAPSGYTFNTMADYLAVCANIPVNSRVAILCEHNHVTSEEMV